MPETKKFLDQSGTSYLWSKIKAQLDLKAAASDVSAISTRLTTAEGKIDALEAGTYDDTELRGLINDKADVTDLETLSDTVDDLISNDTGKSIRTIANEELAAQLITTNADESLNTLQEIAAWIQSHPGDASAMNSAITALQTKLTLGTDTNSQEYATVKAYVEAYVAAQLAASNLSQYASAADLDALELLVGNTAVATQISNAITALDLTNTYEPIGTAASLASNYATAAQGAKADTALQSADVIALTNAEIDTAIANATSGGNSGS